MKHQDIRITDRSELVGRMLLNCFNVEEIAVLPQGCWRYYDWCVEQGLDMIAWVKTADERRSPELTFSENLLGCLWRDECRRFKAGENLPPWKEPEGCYV